ncbi:MAG: hypothetical protein E7262_06350 [Lachnospiraceae bacterium]|nr:hypothetical protein [Lachnospiraceae bacterium]
MNYGSPLKNNKCIVCVYFGNIPNYYDLWLKSVNYNKDYDFLLVTDSIVPYSDKNLTVVNMDLTSFERLAREKLRTKLNIPYAYKLSDFKPVFGIILSDFLKDYEYWGYCDLDIILGDLSAFITEDILEKYDKIFPLGHFALYRNTEEVNNRYKLKGSTFGDYDEVFVKSKIFVFDEGYGINNIYKLNNLPIYDKYVMADIAARHKRLKLTINSKMKNYRYQLFYWDNGKIFRAYIDEDDNMGAEEFAYIHIKRRRMETPDFNIKEVNSFAILSNSFMKKSQGLPRPEDIKIYNPYQSYIYEKFEDITYRTQYQLSRVGRFINRRILKK